METMGFNLQGNLKLNLDKQGVENDLRNLQANPDGSLLGVNSGSGSNVPMFESLVTLNETIQDVTRSFKALLNDMKGYGNGSGGGSSGFGGGNPDDPSQRRNIFNFNPTTGKVITGALGVGSTALGIYQGTQAYQRSMLRGDFLGAEVNGWNSAGGALSGIGGSILSLGTGLMATPAGIPLMLLGGLISGGGLIANAIGSKKQTEKESADIYSETMPVMESLYAAYGNKSSLKGKSGSESAAIIQGLYGNVVNKNIGTGLSDQDYVSKISNLVNSGFTLEQAEKKVTTAARLGNNTNTDADSILSVMGLAARYGDKNATDIEKIYGNRSKMGFTDTQFSELLDGIEGALQSGISKGFSADITGIMSTVASLYSASGNNVFWSGKDGLQAAQTLGQGLANGRNLNDVNDVMLYQAVNGSLSDAQLKSELGESYVAGDRMTNIRTYMSRGQMSASVLQKYIQKLKTIYGNDSASIIEELKKTGLSDDRAAQLYNMSGKLGTVALDNLNDIDTYTTGTMAQADAQNTANRVSTTGANAEKNRAKVLDEATYKAKEQAEDNRYKPIDYEFRTHIQRVNEYGRYDEYDNDYQKKYQSAMNTLIQNGQINPEVLDKEAGLFVKATSEAQMQDAINRLVKLLEDGITVTNGN